MKKLTKNQRHKAYIACLKELYRCKQDGYPFFICPALNRILYLENNIENQADRFKSLGMDDLLKHKPVNANLAWFGNQQYEPRIKILESLIAETEENNQPLNPKIK